MCWSLESKRENKAGKVAGSDPTGPVGTEEEFGFIIKAINRKPSVLVKCVPPHTCPRKDAEVLPPSTCTCDLMWI